MNLSTPLRAGDDRCDLLTRTPWRQAARRAGQALVVSAAVAALPVASAGAATTHARLGGPLTASASALAPNLLYDGSSQLDAGQIPFSYQSFIPGHVSVVTDPINPGTRQVMRYAIADSDRPYSGASNPRGDFETPGYFTNSADLYYSIQFMIPQGFPVLKSSGFFQISEVYGPPHGGSPPIGIDLVPGANGRPAPAFERSAPFGYDKPWVGPTLDAGWHTIIVHAGMSTTNTGFVELWFDGKQQLMSNGQTRISYPTLESGINWDGHTANVLNINQYRKAGAYPGTVVTYQAAAKIGSTLASVMGNSTTPPPPPPPPTLTAAFTAPSTSTRGTTVSFNGSSSTGSPVSYQWTDGTATLGTGQTPSYTFHYAGVKHVTLTITNANGATASVEHNLTVS